MSYYHEFEPFLDEILESEVIFTLLANFGSSVLNIAAYVLTALALYTLANRRGIKHAWLSWIPVVNCWIIGSISDQYRYVVKGEVKNKRKTLLALNIVSAVLGLIMIVLCVAVFVTLICALISGDADAVMKEMVLVPLIIMALLCLPMLGVSIAIAVVRYMALYDIYTSCNPQNNVLYLVLSIIFGITEPFFLFFSRNSDQGMPPRKREPVYMPAQESWNDPEYL